MPVFSAPELTSVIVRSRQLADGQQLDPPADWPALFSCRYHGEPAIGCVYLNGAIVVIPDRCTAKAGPIVFDNWRWVESTDALTDVNFEWQVTRIARVRLAGNPDP